MAVGTGVAVQPSTLRLLVCEVGRSVCGLPLEHVEETLRPPPLEPLATAPACVSGVSIVRGEPIPVIDLRCLLGSAAPPARRLVTIRLAARRAGLLVDGVQGVRRVGADILRSLPPILGEATAEIVKEIGRLDEMLLLVLESGRLVPDAVWSALDSGGTRA